MANQYLLVNILTNRNGIDCTNNGVSVTGDSFFVPCDNGNFSYDDIKNREGAVILETGVSGGRTHFRPKGETGWTMFGGNFAYSCDSRFSATYGCHPIHIHDRIE